MEFIKKKAVGLLTVLVVSLLGLFFLHGGLSKAATDTTPPSAKITATDNGVVGNAKDWYSRQFSTLLDNVSDNVGVTKIEYYLNGELKATNSKINGKDGVQFDATAMKNGTYYLTVKLYDAAGNIGIATTYSGQNRLTFSVDNKDTEAPTGYFPNNDPMTFNDHTNLNEANVALWVKDNVGVTKVEFYLDGNLKYTNSHSKYGTGDPNQYGFNWDISKVANGTYGWTAKIYDAAGNVGDGVVAMNLSKTLHVVIERTGNGGGSSGGASNSCTVNQKTVSNIVNRVINRAQAHLKIIDSVADAAQIYYSTQPKKLDNYLQLSANVSQASDTADKNMVELLSTSSIPCIDGKLDTSQFKQAVATTRSSIEAYRQAVMNLIQALETL